MSRFSGAVGRNLLLGVLRDESIFRDVSDLETFVEMCELQEVPAKTKLINQGDSDNHIFFVISGCFEIQVNGRPAMATRGPGSHLGEIALVDSTARRNATVVAIDSSLVLKCSEIEFTEFANKNPQLWRRLAVSLGRRLTERNRLIPTPRTEPVLFVACSTEALPSAQQIQCTLEHDPVVVEIWTDGVFHTSNTPIEDLTAFVGKIDFAAILLTPDDKISSRSKRIFGPRDNVIFELGLAMGAIGRARTMMLLPRGVDIKLPSDLLGVTPIEYKADGNASLQSQLGPACTKIREIVKRLGPI